MSRTSKDTVLIAHRINTLEQLEKLTPELGCEIDLRSNPSNCSLYLAHDPFTDGVSFESWLARFALKKMRGPLILNTKEDGLEGKLTELLKKYGVTNYFFLDTTLPTLNRLSRDGEKNLALRLSSLEPSTAFSQFVGSVKWLWVDCFQGEPLPVEMVSAWTAKFKICLVSPELQGRPENEISRFLALARLSDAICTKHPHSWSKLLDSSKIRKAG